MEMNSICPNCGSYNSGSSNNCGQCGAPLNNTATQEQYTLCSKCGNKVYPSEKFCNKCGNINYVNATMLSKRISEEITAQRYYKKAKKANNGLRTIGFLLIAISVIIDLVFALLIVNGDVSDMISILPISGIAFTAGLVVVFAFK